MLADVSVFPVPGGPWIRLKGRCNTLRTARVWLSLREGRLGTLQLALSQVYVGTDMYVYMIIFLYIYKRVDISIMVIGDASVILEDMIEEDHICLMHHSTRNKTPPV